MGAYLFWWSARFFVLLRATNRIFSRPTEPSQHPYYREGGNLLSSTEADIGVYMVVGIVGRVNQAVRAAQRPLADVVNRIGIAIWPM